MSNILAVGIGGFIGSILRYLISLIDLKEVSIFPLKTFIINILGCILIGIISVYASKHTVNNEFVLFLKVGLCGGFTTFSTFGLEVFKLISEGHVFIAFLYSFLSVLIGVCIIYFIYFWSKLI